MNCLNCAHSKFVEGFDQPVGCLLHDLTFSQSAPQPTTCPDYMDNEDYCPDCNHVIYPVNDCKCNDPFHSDRVR